MPYSFRGGVHPPQNKAVSSEKPSGVLPAPEKLYFPLSMHVGAPCTPLVSKGDTVFVGQKIADSDAPVSAPIYSSVSGTVLAIEPHDHPGGRVVDTIVVQNDGKLTEHASLTAARTAAERRDPFSCSPEELIGIIREAGIVGMGGAGFPSAFKLSSVLGKIHTLIINAAECEPYITADNRLMQERPDDLILGIRILMHVLSLSHATIAIESNKEKAITLLQERLAGTGILLHVCRTKYPQGSEKHIIKVVTGKEIPSGKLPGDIGCAVMNPASAVAVYDAVCHGIPLIERYVTISGSAIVNPQNFRVRIGTPISELIRAAGGYSGAPYRIIVGGPMMGFSQYTIDVPVIKTTNSVLAFDFSEGIYKETATCIRCGKCVAACPMRLQPMYINLYANAGRYDYCDRNLSVRDCIECGACAYVCPAHVPLIQSIRLTKKKVAPKKK